LAFAIAGYSSFWLIAAMCLPTALVGVNTMLPFYAVSDSAADTIVDIAATVGAFYLILQGPGGTVHSVPIEPCGMPKM
jgi:hypothetical protein